MKTEIRLAGTGGQGVILASVILAEAAVIVEGLNATQSQSYGAAARDANVIPVGARILAPRAARSRRTTRRSRPDAICSCKLVLPVTGRSSRARRFRAGY